MIPLAGGPAQVVDQVSGHIKLRYARLLSDEERGSQRNYRLGRSDTVRVDECALRVPVLGRARAEGDVRRDARRA